MKKKSKAFTLTELLVVVVVIGVLSAVVLPKFSKVIETRRTTEAEELMASIRTEQEKRCALDKKYITGDIAQLNDIVKNPKNYTLELASTGIKASRNNTYEYTLQMPSYADGRICCSGKDCERLNKNYPKCDGFEYEASPESCEGKKVEPSVPPTPPTPCNDCSCAEYAASYEDECNTVPCTDCSCAEYAAAHETECNPQPKVCTGPKPDDKQPCNKCGEQTREVMCNTSTGEWNVQAWGECNTKEENCKKTFIPAIETLAVQKTCYSRTRYQGRSNPETKQWEEFLYARKFIDRGKKLLNTTCDPSVKLSGGTGTQYDMQQKRGVLQTYEAVDAVQVSAFCPVGKSPESLCAENCPDSSASVCGFSCLIGQNVGECPSFGLESVDCVCQQAEGVLEQCLLAGETRWPYEGGEVVPGVKINQTGPVIGSAKWLHCVRK